MNNCIFILYNNFLYIFVTILSFYLSPSFQRRHTFHARNTRREGHATDGSQRTKHQSLGDCELNYTIVSSKRFARRVLENLAKNVKINQNGTDVHNEKYNKYRKRKNKYK